MKRPLLLMSSCRERGCGGAWRHILLLRKTWRSEEGATARQTAEQELCLFQCKGELYSCFVSIPASVPHAFPVSSLTPHEAAKLRWLCPHTTVL